MGTRTCFGHQPAAGTPPLLGHIHVPKCAGTSFRLLLDKLFPRAHLPLYWHPGTERSLPTTFVYSLRELDSQLRAGSVHAFSSHHVRQFPASMAGRPVLYVTFLRRPEDQFLSYLRYTRQVFPHIVDPELLSHLPPNLPHLSLREAAHWLMRQSPRRFLNFRENYTTNFFARYESESRFHLGYANPFYRRFRLGIARRVLCRFFFIGITERMDESLRLLRPQLEAHNFSTAGQLPMPHENVTSLAAAEDVSWLHPADEVGGPVLASLREDRKLYRWALRRFEHRLATAA